ncbi:MAG: manganese efflux pump MntP family protein [Candidatus Marinimicrobia bacterium]|nr:manganese efflux pump MntP family protein [Candidatus Neomarinimicrobiota bacterium]
MDFITIFLLAIGLSMDAFAVAISCGLTLKPPKMRNALRLSGSFGAFQALMPVIGWALGQTLAKYIQNVDHWIAFVLLVFIGGKMIYESLDKDSCENHIDPSNNKVLLTLSIATSIDALAVGVTFAFLQFNIIFPVLYIGITTFCITLLGVYIGKKIGGMLGKKVEIFGGLVLIGIGAKILIEHLCI